jgi:hypothetical protein
MLLINVRAVESGVALVLANREVRDLLSFAHYAQRGLCRGFAPLRRN